MEEINDWLRSGPPWVEYRTRLDLLHQSETESEVVAARQVMMAHPQIKNLISELMEWPGQIVNSHKKADLLMHKLVFAADLGLNSKDPGMDLVVKRILEHPSTQGPFQVTMKIEPHFGGTGETEWAWALCDSPLILYALLKLDLAENPLVKKASEYLEYLVQSNGWPCIVSPEMGKFRGPGRKDDPCPYATLVMVKALAQLPRGQEIIACRTGVEGLLTLWKQRRERAPYIFHMGTDFCKLKAPFIWYDLLHMADVLSQFSFLGGRPELAEMIEIIQSKADPTGRYTPESIWTAWKDWEFGQKCEPSRWLTFLAARIINRYSIFKSGFPTTN